MELRTLVENKTQLVVKGRELIAVVDRILTATPKEHSRSTWTCETTTAQCIYCVIKAMSETYILRYIYLFIFYNIIF